MAQQKRQYNTAQGEKETSGGSGRTASGDSGGTASGSQTSEEGEQEYVQYLEKKLENILMQMDGVGRVDVMITVSDGGEQIVEEGQKRQLPPRRASVIPEAGSAV